MLNDKAIKLEQKHFDALEKAKTELYDYGLSGDEWDKLAELPAIIHTLQAEHEFWQGTASYKHIADLRAENEALRAALVASEKEYGDLAEDAPVSSGCFDCTHGVVPPRYNTGLCAHHLRVRAIAGMEKYR